MSEILWTPSPERVASSQMTAFRVLCAQRSGLALPTSRDLHAYSVAHPGEFWDTLWRWAGVVGERGERPPVVGLEKMPGARWFPESRLNFAENLLRRRDAAKSFQETFRGLGTLFEDPHASRHHLDPIPPSMRLTSRRRRCRPLRIESDEHLWFVTSRVIEERFWLHPVLSSGLVPSQS